MNLARAAALFAVDPAGLGGILVRGPAGPAREDFLRALLDLLPAGAPVRRAPVSIADDRLLGGLDLAATLAAGRPVGSRGVLAEADGGVLILPMAERVAIGNHRAHRRRHRPARRGSRSATACACRLPRALA